MQRLTNVYLVRKFSKGDKITTQEEALLHHSFKHFSSGLFSILEAGWVLAVTIFVNMASKRQQTVGFVNATHAMQAKAATVCVLEEEHVDVTANVYAIL